ncbi:MAG TPA: FecR domain-containing protein [Polyangiales bacterium]|nr:FecR domain-containing protein [Polyangiales bacterium]
MSTPLRSPLREVLRDPADPKRVQAVWQRVQARRQPRVRALRWALPALAAASCAALIAIAPQLRWTAQPTPSEPSAATTTAPGRVPTARQALRFANGAALHAIATGAEAQARIVSLSDGTRIALDHDTRLVPRSITGQLTALVLERGRARFEVAPQGARRFEVSAGSLTVVVVGTAFTVTAAANETLVAVEHGRVRVHAPTGDTLLTAGQSSRWPELAPSPSSAAQPIAADDSLARTPPTQRPAAPDAEALLQLADSARAGGRPEDAARALQRLLSAHPRDVRTPLAALTLARLQLDTLRRPREAARSFGRALELGLPQALREDALASRVRALHAAGDRAGSARAAEAYTRNYPNGRFIAEVQRWSSVP